MSDLIKYFILHCVNGHSPYSMLGINILTREFVPETSPCDMFPRLDATSGPIFTLLLLMICFYFYFFPFYLLLLLTLLLAIGDAWAAAAVNAPEQFKCVPFYWAAKIEVRRVLSNSLGSLQIAGR